MKKTLLAAAVATVAAMTACSNNQQEQAAENQESTDTISQQTYTGTLPAADAEAVVYTITFDYPDAQDATTGTYNMEQKYVDKDTSSFKTDGTFTVAPTPKDNTKKYIKLTPKATTDDVAGATPADTLYFLVETDTTITMVSPALEPSANKDLNYTLKRTK